SSFKVLTIQPQNTSDFRLSSFIRVSLWFTACLTVFTRDYGKRKSVGLRDWA
ncbi:hypothetical protein L9F63_025078, partial [Diploptera punctata]